MLTYWKWIATPMIGAVIGYATNWVAVKMLFRPRNGIYVFGKKLPFTPGVIPKGKARLAKAVGQAVEKQLLTKEVLQEVLLSEEKKAMIVNAVSVWLQKQRESENTLRKTAVDIFSEEKTGHFVERAEESMTNIIYNKILQMNVGEIIADKVMEAATDKLKDSMFGMMMGSSFLEPIARQVEDKVNEYVAAYGKPVVEQMVLDESAKLQEKTVGETLCQMEEYDIDIPSFAIQQYEAILSEKLPQILELLQLSSIVEDRINAMDVAEVEELMLSIMKKELRAVVNLGALIGLILGFINVLIFYM